jgi:hypothetical protein
MKDHQMNQGFTPPPGYISVELPKGFMPDMNGMVADAIFLPFQEAVQLKKQMGIITTVLQETKEIETHLYEMGAIPVVSK